MPDRISKAKTDTQTGADPAPTDPQLRPAPTKATERHIVAEERSSDGSYTIWWSDGSMESGQGA